MDPPLSPREAWQDQEPRRWSTILVINARPSKIGGVGQCVPFITEFEMQDVIERIVGIVSGLGFVLPIAIFALVNLFSRKNKGQPAQDQRPRRTSTQSPQPQRRLPGPTMQPMPSFPNGPVTWLEPAVPVSELPAPRPERSGWGSTFGGNDAEKRDHALQWGSAFDDNDIEKRDHGLQWGSAFDRQQGRSKWGWDEAEWGSGFAKKKDSEPRITIG